MMRRSFNNDERDVELRPVEASNPFPVLRPATDEGPATDETKSTFRARTAQVSAFQYVMSLEGFV